MKGYHDKFLAHLGDRTIGNYPDLEIAKESCFYLYDYLLTNEYDYTSFHDAPEIGDYFSQSLAEGQRIDSSIVSI